MQKELALFDQSVVIIPRALADATFERISPEVSNRFAAYLSTEMLTGMARKLLAKRFSHNSDDNESYQGDLFSGTLQLRYPLPRKKGEEPAYKLRQHLTPDERARNVSYLRKSANARLEHADALEAEGLSHRAAA